MRRFLFIAGIAVASVAIFIGGYYFFANRATISVGTQTGDNFPGAGSVPAGTSPGATTTTVTLPNGAGSINQATLVQVAKGPVVPGLVAFDETVSDTDPNATTTASSTPTYKEVEVRYVERQSGNVYGYKANKGVLTRLSNRTIPGVQQALWLSDGSLAYLRYLSQENGTDVINTYALPASGIGGYFLARNIDELDVSGSSAILVQSSGANGSIATKQKVDGSGGTQAFSTSLSDIISRFAGAAYAAYTKASGVYDGYAFLTDTAGNLMRVAGPLKGLVALPSPNGSTMLISYVDAGIMKLELLDTKTREVTKLPIGTIADKCAWSGESTIYCGVPSLPPSAIYPDDWYQGAVSFNDRIWSINVTSRYVQMELDFSQETKQQLDATSLAVDPSGSILSFINKNDGSLWVLRTK